jgi:hypothetical protein
MNSAADQPSYETDKGFLPVLIGDGRPLIVFTGLVLALAGAFALFLSARWHFLPHDVQFLGLTAEQLCGFNRCNIVRFMFHDRVSFGGALIAIGTLYIWLAEFPLRARQGWAWWTLLLSGVTGFGSFLAYLGYGYLDSWHGTATLVLLPLFVAGLVRTRSLVTGAGPGCLLTRDTRESWLSALGIGRALLIATAAGMILGGTTIMIVGMTSVFVPQDLEFMMLQPEELRSISSRLIPLIAHDRAGFGGAITTMGIIVLATAWCARPARSLWQALCVAGLIGFGTAIGIHPVVGYNNLAHLAPALAGAVMFIAGLVFSYRPMVNGSAAVNK